MGPVGSHMTKTHHTAVVAIPPPEVWEPIQDIRQRHDRHVQRWMPHITLLYPFMLRSRFADVMPRLTAACSRLTPFYITLTRFGFFPHGRNNATLWLAPEPLEALVALQATLQASFPEYDDVSRYAAGFTPHLSVGQTNSVAARQHVLDDLQATWQPLHFQLTAVTLIWRQGSEPFQIHASFSFGAL